MVVSSFPGTGPSAAGLYTGSAGASQQGGFPPLPPLLSADYSAGFLAHLLHQMCMACTLLLTLSMLCIFVLYPILLCVLPKTFEVPISGIPAKF